MENKNKTANPACLGLLGFGMTTVLLNFHNAGLTDLTVVIAAMGFALGGAAQIIAGIMEYKLGNTFGATAFTAYGFFWWSLVLIWWNPFSANIAAGDAVSMGIYLTLWGIFTAFMFVGTLKHNTVSKVIFSTLTVLFFLLAASDFTGIGAVKVVAGYVGIICGLSAVYSAVGQAVNEESGKKILPL